MKFDVYDPQNGPFYDEMFAATGVPRPGFEPLVSGINALEHGSLLMRQAAAERSLLSMGITFTLYGEGGSSERIFPFDVIPRVVSSKEWERIERGLRQRIEALNLFLCDVYGDQKILKDKVVPEELIKTCADFRPQCIGLKPPRGIWCHIVGTDLVRDKNGEFYVLEDNLRCPSGVSYVLENRQILKRTFPRVLEQMPIRSV
ncbi:MAG: circularly permuted type 2 ATP-grasp protein, partial [Polyangiaceae bacterium]